MHGYKLVKRCTIALKSIPLLVDYYSTRAVISLVVRAGVLVLIYLLHSKSVYFITLNHFEDQKKNATSTMHRENSLTTSIGKKSVCVGHKYSNLPCTNMIKSSFDSDLFRNNKCLCTRTYIYI